MNHQVRSSRIRNAWMIASRLCMIISLWQAPIPWFHCHGTNVSQLTSIASALELSSHLAVYHFSIGSDEDHDLGWHFHWVLPCWSHVVKETSDTIPPAESVVAFDQATISPTVSTIHGGQIASVGSVVALPRFSKLVNHGTLFEADRPDPVSRFETGAMLRC